MILKTRHSNRNSINLGDPYYYHFQPHIQGRVAPFATCYVFGKWFWNRFRTVCLVFLFLVRWFGFLCCVILCARSNAWTHACTHARRMHHSLHLLLDLRFWVGFKKYNNNTDRLRTDIEYMYDELIVAHIISKIFSIWASIMHQYTRFQLISIR